MIKKMNPLVIAGFAFILAGLIETSLYPLATIRFGELEVIGISSFSALCVFIGLVLISLGMRKGKQIYK